MMKVWSTHIAAAQSENPVSQLLTPVTECFGSVSYTHLDVYKRQRFLRTLGHPHVVALHFTRCGQLAGGLATLGLRPCWAHKKTTPEEVAL